MYQKLYTKKYPQVEHVEVKRVSQKFKVKHRGVTRSERVACPSKFYWKFLKGKRGKKGNG